MTAVVQPDLGPPPAHKYKDDPSDDSLRHLGSNHSHQHPQNLQQHSRPGGLLHQHNQRPDSPHQHTGGSLPTNPYSAPSGLNGLSLQHPPPPQYPPAAQEPGYYTSHAHPYPATTTPAQYPSSGPPDLMAATAQMQRPYPPIYQTAPQSNSPVSVTSPPTHDQHGRSLYAQSPQIASQMYSYGQPYSPMNPVHPAYNPQPPAPPQHPLTTQPLMMPPQTAPIQHTIPSTHQPAMSSSTMGNNSPRLKVDPIPQQHTPGQNQRPSISASTLTSPNPSVPPLSANNVHVSHPTGTNPTNAAPGPIPATTPQLVRQDSNGVQWIAFEYSRDRVKMEYTIRCDVESVNVEALSADFKTENCVYPRACCSKEQYRGNRLVYETECNAVGWALAELNPPLRGKRGLIQRAVDSWRNSNQDPRLRSRRVRRMAKMNRRQANQQPNHQLGGNAAPVPHLLTHSPVGLAPTARPPTAPLTLAAPPLQHHTHHADGQAGNEEVSGSTDLSNGAQRPPYVPTSAKPPISDAHESTPGLRPGQVYHGMLSYPATAHTPSGLGAPSIAPPLQGGGFDIIGRQSVATASSQRHQADDSYETEGGTGKPGDKVLFGNLPVGKRRKFILVEDHQRGGRARVKVTLDRVNINEIPDSYRLTNAVYPRAYYPVQMKGSPGHTVPDSRYLEDNDADDNNDDDDDYELENGNDPVTVGRTIVTVPSIEGLSMPVPQLTRSRHRKDKIINDFGYRMSWSQSRVFATRHLFLQRSLDAYRNKMRGSMLTIGQEPESIASHFETRIGRRKFNTRRQRKNEGSSISASRREAEEVEA
ncbi:conserved hypothetical protein [Talaromyces stipitatus ATCC 10500]|uniref:DUF8032 domain-containing protein n=1 Tax=Talaromyces stipitatus (strain ATCC 10500 / CBS 375.48 / QM 6759 / NRRL 1006) TaxID=441959 RepID=B8MCZ2_TALSN|nr:uncharacterized protein TSTA_113440 [Talaromyces stipitatus ATCC 10500]EED17518.1 conserved hypothetical protein [Talaromyces stipitatus ATCC 10500]